MEGCSKGHGVLRPWLCATWMVAAPFALRAAAPAGTLAAALSEYESGMVALTASASPEDRAAAISGLAAVSSPRYAAVRDALASDPSSVVQAALLEAAGVAGDVSPEALALLEAGLRSEDLRVLNPALRWVQQDTWTSIPFAPIWRKDRVSLLWTGRASTPRCDRLVGIGQARPWLDPAWEGVDDLTKMSLLFRAGTRESVPLGVKVALSKTPPRFWITVLAEPVDVPYLKELLEDPHPEIRRYANRALVEAGVPGAVERIQEFIYEYRSGIHGIPDEAVGDLGVGAFLPRLDQNSLYGLLVMNPKEWFWPVYGELGRRGTPLKYAELRGWGKSGSLFNLSAVEPWLLRRCQLETLVRERVYSDLPDYFVLYFADPNPAQALGDLERTLLCAPAFREAMPPATAAACRGRVQDWLAKSPQEGGPPATNPNGADSARSILLYLSDPADWDAAWAKLHASKEPWKEKESLETVLRGRDPRAEALRRHLAPYRGTVWFATTLGHPVASLLKGVQTDRVLPDPCGRPMPVPLALPKLPPGAGALGETLTSAMARAGVATPEQFARAFLEARGFRLDDADLEGLWAPLASPWSPLRRQATVLLIAARPDLADVAGASPLPGQEESWLRAVRERLSEERRDPRSGSRGLGKDDLAWLEALLQGARRSYFGGLVAGITAPGMDSRRTETGSVIPGFYAPPGPSLALPSDVFLREAGAEFLPEIRGCLKAPEAAVRHAAAFALWEMLHDPEALVVMKRGAESPERGPRVEALNLLQFIRCEEAAPLFPPLLEDADPLLRQVGLLGVRRFGMRGLLPRVLFRVVDPDQAVASWALVVLADWRPPEARPLFMELVRQGGPLAQAATYHLRRYRSVVDLDALLAAACEEGTPDAARRRFLGILSDITGRIGPQPVGQAATLDAKGELAPETLADWKRWWAAHREQPSGERAKGVILDQLRALASATEEGQVGRLPWSIKQGFPGFSCLESGWGRPKPECQATLSKWVALHQNDDPWTFFTSPEADPLVEDDLLWEIDPARARKALFASFYGPSKWTAAPSLWQSPGTRETLHDRIVRRAGVDFGDPGPARCGLRENILADWLAWARREGWSE